MKIASKWWMIHAVAAGCLFAADPSEAASASSTCGASKMGTSGKYAACRLGADAKAYKAGAVPDYGKCSLAKFADAEAKAGVDVCPSQGDETLVQDFLNACTTAVSNSLDGAPLPLDVLACDSSLTTCYNDLFSTNSELASCFAKLGVLQTGLTYCYNVSGSVISCTGSGQDAQYQSGVASSYQDNGDGTVTDNVTGLMWEKLSDDGSIHDWDSFYSFSGAITVKIAALNSASFAGHSDWRLPNIRELQTLVHYEHFSPSTHFDFDSGCLPGCAATSCSCTQSAHYWSSSTMAYDPTSAWALLFDNGSTVVRGKTTFNYVRAVRGGY